jgi:hypothetical protein
MPPTPAFKWANRHRRVERFRSSVHRYRLIDQDTGGDIGPLVSGRLTFAVGEEISGRCGERYVVMGMVEPENENFRAYIVVRQS